MEDPQLTGDLQLNDEVNIAEERDRDSVPGPDGSLTTYALLKEVSPRVSIVCKIVWCIQQIFACSAMLGSR